MNLEKDNKSKKKIIIGIIIIFVLMICCCNGCGMIFKNVKKNNKSNDKEVTKEIETATEEATPEPTLTATATPIQYKTIAYNELARYPNKYKKEYIIFSGKVIQVIEGEKDKPINFRIEVDGDYKKVIYCIYTYTDKSKGRILKDDIVTFKGMFTGLVTYESALGGNITIPAMILNEITIK